MKTSRIYSFIIISSVLLFQVSYTEKALDYFNQAEILYKKEEYKQALSLYKKTVELNPYFAHAYYRIGDIYIKLSLYKEAVDNLKKAIKIMPRFKEAYLSLGKAYEKAKVYKWSRWAYNKAKSIDIACKEAYLGLARLAYYENKLSQAKNLYQRVLDIDPEDSRAYFGLGRLQEKKYKDFRKALDYYKLAKKYSPFNIKYILTLARLYKKQKEFQNAKDEYLEGLNIDSKNKQILRGLGQVYLELKDLKAAESLYKKGIKLYPTDKILRLGLAYTKSLLKRPKEAADEYQKAYKLTPDDEIIAISYKKELLKLNLPAQNPQRLELAKYFYTKAEKYQTNGDILLALFNYKSSIKLSPLEINYRLPLANLLINKGYYNSAQAELEKILILDKENLQAQDLIEKINFQLEDTLTYKYEIPIDEIKPKKYKLLLYTENKEQYHPQTKEVLKGLIAELLDLTELIKIFHYSGKEKYPALKTFIQEATSKAMDYLCIINFSETKQSIKVVFKLIDMNTLKELITNRIIIKEGNDKLKEVASYIAKEIKTFIPRQGRIIKIIDNKILINLGKFFDIKQGDIFKINKLGKLKITKVEERVAEVSLVNPKLLKFIRLNQLIKKE